ncbi:hypothetical protein [Nocardia sp. NPDC050710]|uniref:hypothetical protein n=1 Tax=Nocardia sp. NPDC050710 TaxID=3157220 RepID=UPI0033C0995F
MNGTSPNADTQELHTAFDVQLARAMAGEAVHNHTGLDSETFRALARIAGAHPTIPPALIEAAHTAFEGQLNGSNEDNGLPSFMRGKRSESPR